MEGTTPSLLTPAMMVYTQDEVIAGFPHFILPKVTGEPTFEDLNIIQRLLNTNAVSVSSYEGGGRHSHLGLIMTNNEYFSVATCVPPPSGSHGYICGGHGDSADY
jgi:hypothetical protein